MSFTSALQLVPGKQNRPRFGLRGSKEAPKARPLDNFGFLTLRPTIAGDRRRFGGAFHA
jgi:hypothetical protein